MCKVNKTHFLYPSCLNRVDKRKKKSLKICIKSTKSLIPKTMKQQRSCSWVLGYNDR